jgi:phasin family protein
MTDASKNISGTVVSLPSANTSQGSATSTQVQGAKSQSEPKAKKKTGIKKKATATKKTVAKKTKIKKAKTPVSKAKTKAKKAVTSPKAKAKAKTTAKQKPSIKEAIMATTNTTKQYEQMSKQAYAGFEQMTTMGKEFFDAWVQCSNIATTGAQELFKENAANSQKAAEKASDMVKELMGCRSLNEFTEKHSQYTQQTLNETLASATELTEKYIKLCTEAAEPLNKKITSAVEKASKQAA